MIETSTKKLGKILIIKITRVLFLKKKKKKSLGY